jgi:hypothetical protein
MHVSSGLVLPDPHSVRESAFAGANLGFQYTLPLPQALNAVI